MKKAIFLFLLISLFVIGCTPQEVPEQPETESMPEPESLPEVEEKEMVKEEVMEKPVEEVKSKTVEVLTKGLTFTPDTVTLNKGDKVKFILGSTHNAVEVSKETWDKNRKTPLADGFSVGFGKTGEISFDKPGTYYYVCQPHVGARMKGVVIVR